MPALTDVRAGTGPVTRIEIPMSITSLNLRQGSHQGSAPVPWTTVAVLAVLMSFADGFILISILGAVGAIERAQAPFASWLRISILMLPVFVLAVLGGLAFARNRFGRSAQYFWSCRKSRYARQCRYRDYGREQSAVFQPSP